MVIAVQMVLLIIVDIGAIIWNLISIYIYM